MDNVVQGTEIKLDTFTKDAFTSLFTHSESLKDAGNQAKKLSLEKALEQYHDAILVFLAKLPTLTNYKHEFSLEWRVMLDEVQKAQVLRHLAVVFSNVSLVYIELKKPLMALYYARFSLWCDESFFKANLRISKALLELLHLSEAQELLDTLKTYTSSSQFQNELKALSNESSQLVEEYSSTKTVVQSLRGKQNLPEECTYKGPIELFESIEKGRGFRARRNIARGEVLMIERGSVFGGKMPEFCYKLIEKLDMKPDLKASYMNLFPSKSYPLSKEFQNNVQEKIREHTLKKLFNSYCEARPADWKNFTKEEAYELLYKVRLNIFKAHGVPALYPNFCLFNHSCDPNTSVWYMRDMVLVLARREISKGEETCVSYTPVAEDVVQRKNSLSVYGFDCHCDRCNLKGDWKEKEARVNGLKCPSCGIEVACDVSRKFECPNKCWTATYADYLRLSKELDDDLLKHESFGADRLEELLVTTEKQFSRFHNNHGLVLYTLAKTYALKKDERRFKRCFSGVVEMIEFFPSLELRKIFNSLLAEIIQNFSRQPTKDELKHLVNYGISEPGIEMLWDKFINTKNQKWFLPFEVGDCNQ